MKADITSTAGKHEGTLMECIEWHKRTKGEDAEINVESGDWFSWHKIANDGKTAKETAARILTTMAMVVGEGIVENADSDPEWLRELAYALREIAREAEKIGL